MQSICTENLGNVSDGNAKLDAGQKQTEMSTNANGGLTGFAPTASAATGSIGSHGSTASGGTVVDSTNSAAASSVM